ncbi:MAG: hypothetical protein ACF8XB_20945 [Planctomycetota bacterium JB042]
MSNPIFYRNEAALRDVLEERENQDRRWGEQNHDFGVFLAILQEEVGEASVEFLELRRHEREGLEEHAKVDRTRMREELVQVAAVALAMVEAFDRGACR